MRLQSRLVRRDGIKDSGDAVRDIILDDISDEQRRQVDTHDRIDQIKPVGACAIELACKQQYDLIDDPMEHKSSHGRKEADKQSENDHEHLLADMLHAPLM